MEVKPSSPNVGNCAFIAGSIPHNDKAYCTIENVSIEAKTSCGKAINGVERHVSPITSRISRATF